MCFYVAHVKVEHVNKKWFCQLSVGLESPEDIIEDLDQALKAAGQGAEES